LIWQQPSFTSGIHRKRTRESRNATADTSPKSPERSTSNLSGRARASRSGFHAMGDQREIDELATRVAPRRR
jgi:hypothetical protein